MIFWVIPFLLRLRFPNGKNNKTHLRQAMFNITAWTDRPFKIEINTFIKEKVN